MSCRDTDDNDDNASELCTCCEEQKKNKTR